VVTPEMGAHIAEAKAMRQNIEAAEAAMLKDRW
jgi:hypothetical protein